MFFLEPSALQSFKVQHLSKKTLWNTEVKSNCSVIVVETVNGFSRPNAPRCCWCSIWLSAALTRAQNQNFRKQNAFASRPVAVHLQWWGVPQKTQSGNCFLGNVFEMLLMPQTTVCGLTRVSNCHFLSCPPLSPSSLHHTQENTNSNGTLASEFNPIFHCTANFEIIERVEINTSRRWKGQKNVFFRI